jgi:hypothetical protein
MYRIPHRYPTFHIDTHIDISLISDIPYRYPISISRSYLVTLVLVLNDPPARCAPPSSRRRTRPRARERGWTWKRKSRLWLTAPSLVASTRGSSLRTGSGERGGQGTQLIISLSLRLSAEKQSTHHPFPFSIFPMLQRTRIIADHVFPVQSTEMVVMCLFLQECQGCGLGHRWRRRRQSSAVSWGTPHLHGTALLCPLPPPPNSQARW